MKTFFICFTDGDQSQTNHTSDGRSYHWATHRPNYITILSGLYLLPHRILHIISNQVFQCLLIFKGGLSWKICILCRIYAHSYLIYQFMHLFRFFFKKGIIRIIYENIYLLVTAGMQVVDQLRFT